MAAQSRPQAADTGLPTGQPGKLIGILATTDLGLGSNRISFLLEDPTGFVTLPQVSLASVYQPEDGSAPVAKEAATAALHVWPYGVRANYTTLLTFDAPGRWFLDIDVPGQADGPAGTRIPLKVARTTHTPAVGAPAPVRDNRTLRDVSSLEELTSWYSPDPEMHTTTISEAVASREPTMLVFSSPGICTTPTCGPQADTVREIKEKYRFDANFIHVEVYDNPADIQGDLSRARYSPVVEAWGLTAIEGYLNESWVFILDRQGRVASKYEGYAAAEELEAGLRATLQ
jgi:hypothetical protein